MENIDAVRQRFTLLEGVLDQRTRRLVAAAEALTLGWGGVTWVARATGFSRRTIQQGMQELQQPERVSAGRVRKPGGGRKTTVSQDPTLLSDLERLVEPVTRGDPESPLRWTCKSLRNLAAELQQLGHRVSRRLVGDLLHRLEYSLQANSKTLEGGDHPDRDADGQFTYLNQQAQTYLDAGEPVISVDAKKKELVGNFKNGGRELRPQGDPERVRVYDFVIPALGRATPYGIYDVAENTWVNVGVDHDTAAFAVEVSGAGGGGWGRHGIRRQPLLVNADGGGSNGSRVRLWKRELQRFADETGLTITVGHLPPGTASGTRSNTGCFRSSRRTGGASRW